MAATLKALGEEREVERRIAVLGPMRELGERERALHAALARPIARRKVDRLILVGDEMEPLAGRWTARSEVDAPPMSTEAAPAAARAGPGRATRCW